MNRQPLLAGVAIGAVALLALTACAPRDGGSTGDGAAAAPAELTTVLPAGQTPVEEVTWSIVEGEPATLDPASSANLIIPNLCENLLRLEPDFSVTEGLATRAEWVDPVTFEIDLREGVTFWDGTPMTAADVVYSLQRNTTPDSQWYAAFVLVSSIEQTGDLQVTVRFNAPDSIFRDALSGGGGTVMSQAHAGQTGGQIGTSETGLMCTGPFQLENWVPGSEIVTSANPNYWGGAPLVDTMKYVFITDSTTLTTALTAGEIDGAFNVPPASRAALEGDGAGTLVVGPSTASYSFGPTTAEGPAANPMIRQALSLAIDRQQYIDTVLNGLGYVQKTLVPPFSFEQMEASAIYTAGYEALATPEVDLERAKELVAESGEDVSQPIVIAVPAGATEFQQTAQIIQSAGAQIGLTIEIDAKQPSDFGALFYDPAGREGTDFVSTQGYLDSPGVLGYPSLFMLPAEVGGVFNWSGYSNPEVTELMQAARTTPDLTAAAEAYVAAQEIFAPDQLQVSLAGAYHLTYVSKELTGAVTSIAAYSSPWALALGGK